MAKGAKNNAKEQRDSALGEMQTEHGSSQDAKENTPELAKGIAGRKLACYEERVAARAYAYGVSDRRIHRWIQSTIGGRVGRSIDRSWPGFVRDLAQRWSTDHSPALSDALATEIIDLCQVLRCAVPQVHVVQPGSDLDLPVILPMASANGLDLRLWVNVEELESMTQATRSFWLGHALGHLQCGHGIYFSTRMRMKIHGESSAWQWLLPVLRRAARLMVFSADRAGAGACASIEQARSVLLTDQAARIQEWMGQTKVSTPLRLQALEDFGKTANFERMVQLKAQQQAQELPMMPVIATTDRARAVDEDPFRRLDTKAFEQSAEPTINDTEPRWSLAYCDLRLTQGLGMY